MTLNTIATAICAVAIPILLTLYEGARLNDEKPREETEHP